MKFAVLIDNIVQSIHESSEPFGYALPYVEIDITDYEGDVGSRYTYDPASHTFTEAEAETPEPKPEPEPVASPEQELLKVQKQVLVNTEYLILLGENGGM